MVLLILQRPTEMLAGAEGYVSTDQGFVHELVDIRKAFAFHDSGNVWEQVESAVGCMYGNTVDRIKTGNGRIASPTQLVDDGIGTRWIAFDGINHAPLDEVSRAGFDVGIEFADHVDGRLRPDGCAEPPACHGEALRAGIENNRPLLHAGQADDRLRSATVLNFEIGLVT